MLIWIVQLIPKLAEKPNLKCKVITSVYEWTIILVPQDCITEWLTPIPIMLLQPLLLLLYLMLQLTLANCIDTFVNTTATSLAVYCSKSSLLLLLLQTIATINSTTTSCWWTYIYIHIISRALVKCKHTWCFSLPFR